MRFTEKWKKMQERNTENQKKTYHASCLWKKEFSRRRNEIVSKFSFSIKLTGKTLRRAEFFIETRTKPNENFVCEEAKERAEALTKLLSQNRHNTNNVTASLDDEYAQVFDPERLGQVRCVGRGHTPSKLVCRSTANRQDIENSEMVIELKTQKNELSYQVKWMTTFIQQIIGTSTGSRATSFAVAFANIPNPTFDNIPDPPNPDQVNVFIFYLYYINIQMINIFVV
ncbi:unnamed protein product [Brassica rapa subsp. trilocularis]